MSFETMASRLTGWVPKLPKSEAYNIVNSAWLDIRNDRIWSFQLMEDGFQTPNVITAGSVTAQLGNNQLTLDANATAALTGLTLPLITQRQFSIEGYSIYNIVGLSGSTLTLDRPFVDPPAGPGLSYQVFQAYVVAPVADFKRWIDWRDMFNEQWLSIYTTRRDINIGDPARLYYTFPYWVLPFQMDNRPGTSTQGWPMFELYPNPLQNISYMRWWIRTGADLINPADTLPYPVPESLVNRRARMLAYQWAEGQKDPSVARGAGTDYKFLVQAAEAEYIRDLRLVGLKDRDLVDQYYSRIGPKMPVKLPYYSTLTNRAFSGS
jgi:hypothetical protein